MVAAYPIAHFSHDAGRCYVIGHFPQVGDLLRAVEVVFLKTYNYLVLRVCIDPPAGAYRASSGSSERML